MSGTEVAEVLRASSPQNALLISFRRLREWIDLPAAERARRIGRALASEPLARSFVQAKSLVWGRLAREFAAPSVDCMGALSALDARTASGSATTANLEYVRRVQALLAINSFVIESFPAAATAAAPDPQLDEIVAMVPATHGSSVLAGNAHNDPLNCGIALCDGLLDGWQLTALDIQAELVVLASCYSGQRAIGGRGLAKLQGDDVFGLQAVLFEAGAGAILGALWPVDDESSRAILVDFHRQYAPGSDPDRALQSALLAYLANPFRRHGRSD